MTLKKGSSPAGRILRDAKLENRKSPTGFLTVLIYKGEPQVRKEQTKRKKRNFISGKLESVLTEKDFTKRASSKRSSNAKGARD